MTNMRHMDADLMRAPGFQLAGDEARHLACAARPFENLDKPPMGYGMAAALSLGDRNSFTVDCVAAERRIDDPGRPLRHAPDEGEIFALEPQVLAMIGKELR